MNKFRVLFGLMIVLVTAIGIFGCASQKELVRFTTEGDFLVLTKSHITGVTLENDAAGKLFANMQFSKDGQKKISEFTGNNLNSKLSIISNSKVLIKDIKIRDKITSKSMMFSFGSDKEAKEFVTMVAGEIQQFSKQ